MLKNMLDIMFRKQIIVKRVSYIYKWLKESDFWIIK